MPFPPLARTRLAVLNLFLLLVFVSGTSGRAAAAPVADEAALKSVSFLLSNAVTVGDDRTFHELLRSLRHLRDPSLKPLFEHLADSDRAVLQIHGILGLAEIAPDKRVDLKRVIALSDSLAQAELITAALDDELLDLDACEQIIASEGVDASVRLLVASELVRRGKTPPASLLDEAIASDNPGRQHLAALLKLQLGDPQGQTMLTALNQWQDARRDGVRLMVLDTIFKYRFEKGAAWALTLAAEPGVDPRLGAAGLRVAMRFGAPGADDLWLRQFQTTTDAAEQTRLAMLAFQKSPWANAKLYDSLKASSDPLIKQLGVAGEAIAIKRGVAPAVVGLIQLNNPTANRAAMGYANEEAELEDSKLILLALILAYEQGPRELGARLLDDAITATQLLYEKDNDGALALLRPILTDPNTNERLAHAILLGLVRTQQPGAERILTGVPAFTNPHHASMALLLRAKSDAPLSEAEMSELALLVRGGGRLQDTLRLQAGWAYVKRVGREKAVLASVL